MTYSTWSLAELADTLADIENALVKADNQDEALTALTEIATSKIASADYAGITLSRNGTHHSLAPTDDVVLRIDEIQYRLGSGPCVDAIERDTRFNVADLRSDNRWPRFGPEAADAAGISSMLAFRLNLETEPAVDAALNLYAVDPSAFDDADEATGLLLATAGALALTRALARERAQHLERALDNSRTIGVATGVLMTQHKITRERAFDLLRIASQETNRKLADLADDVEQTGALPPLPRARAPQALNATSLDS